MKSSLCFEQRLRQAGSIVLDGGLATELEAQGFELGTELWSAKMLQEQPEAIVAAHLAYFEAGAQCTISASYQATQAGLMGLGLSEPEADALMVLSVELAIQARDQFMALHPDASAPLVAASIGPYGASLADGSEYTGDYDIDDAALLAFHRDRLSLLDGSGADLLACETIPSIQEARVLHELLESTQLPAWVSFSCKDGKHLNDGTPIRECAQLFAGHPRVKAIGVNCSSPAHINSLIKTIRAENTGLEVVVYPNSGETYDAQENCWHGTATALECGVAAKSWLNSGAKIVGGCCRMGPEHISEIANRVGHS